MPITPLDIQNKEFERSFRGYDIEDVDEFLDRVAKDLEQLIRENVELKDQLSQLQEKNKNYQKLEETMHNAIVVAQETAEEVKQNAKREADFVRREAEKDAQRVVEDARYRASKILSEQEELFKQARIFKMRFRSFVEAQLSALENEDWLIEAHEDQAREEEKPELDPRTGYETPGYESTPGYKGSDPESSELEAKEELRSGPDFESEPGSRRDYDFDSGTDYEREYDFDSKPGYGREFDFEPRTDFNDKPGFEEKPNLESGPDFDPRPEFDPSPDFEPKYDFESTRKFDKDKDFRPKKDHDSDPDK